MNVKKVHYISGLVITLFVGLHLMNHCFSVFGAEKHIEVMTALRHFYRYIIVEIVLFFAILIQIFSGLSLFLSHRKYVKTFFEKLHIWTGLYLALFLVIHVSAVFAGRVLLNLDTNFYFGVAGLNNFPSHLFFIPYYALAIVSFFGHVSAIHGKKMKRHILGLSPHTQSKLILGSGIILTFFILFGLTNHFKGVKIPTEYNILIGK